MGINNVAVADLGWFLGFHGTPLSYNKAGRVLAETLSNL